MNAPHRFTLVAGENSGDTLGADLIRFLKQQFPDASFDGIGGKRMIAEGMQSFYPLERLSVMGLFEPLKRLPELLSIRKHIIQHCLNTRPSAFIGIDSPDFNLSIERKLKQQGIKTVHYVSPTVWAWRKGRIKTIKKAVDLMLTLFPFEMHPYLQHEIPNHCVGHPLADTIPLSSDKIEARQALNLPTTGRLVALLPGSRAQELRFLAPTFLDTARWLLKKDPTIRFISAFPEDKRVEQFEQLLQQGSPIPIQIFKGQSLPVMAASDAILVASGTASFEAMLVKRPTVVAYKMAKLTFSIAKRIIDVPYIALPNLLANRSIMPEYIQDEASAEQLGQTLWQFLQQQDSFKTLESAYTEIHLSLKKNAGALAAQQISQLIC